MKKQLVTPKSELGRRLGAVMKARGLSASAWSLKANLQRDFVSQVLRGRSLSPSAENLRKLADAAQVNLDYLLLRSNDMDLPDRAVEIAPIRYGMIPMVGYIGAGAQVIPFGIGEEIERIEAPPGIDGGIAAEVRGISMLPVYRPGDLVIGVEHLGEIDRLAGSDCFVQVQDGPLYLKVIRKGSKPKTYSLESYNKDEPTIRNQIIEWAAPVRWVKRK